MPERPSALQIGQWGVETTLGTIVAANKRLLCTNFNPDPSVPTVPYRPSGFLAPVTAIQQKEATAIALEGVTCYHDLPYLLSSLLLTASPSTPSGGTLTRRWSFKPSATAVDLFKSYTLEKGTASQAERIVGAVVNSLTMRWTRTEANLSGTMMGQITSESVTITPTPTDIPALPIDPKSFSIYVGSSTATSEVQTLAINGATGTFILTYEGQSTAPQAVAVSTAALQTALQGLSSIGTNNILVTGTPGTSYTLTFAGILSGIDASTFVVSGATGGPPTITVTTPGSLTKLTRVDSFELAIPDRYAFAYTLDDAIPSWSYPVQLGVEPRASLVLEHDSVGAGIMADLRARTTKFCRVVCRGPAIEAGFPANLILTFPFKYIDNNRGDTNGVYMSTYPLALMYDSGFAGFIQADVDTSVTAL
jgi:hypothetical protein